MVATDLFFSEYVEGSSFNKALEIANFTGDVVDLSQYTVEIYFNGSLTPATTLTLAGTLADGDVFVIADDGSDAAILAVADLTPGNNFFNGDDAIALRKNGALIDVFGQIGVDPGTSWPGGGADVTLRRLPSVIAGDTNGSDPFDAAVEWESFPNNTFDGLGSHAIDGGTPGTPQALVINEVLASHTGTDTTEFVELFGAPGTSLAGLSLIVVESEVIGLGTIDRRIDFTAANVVGENGFFLIGNPAGLAANYGVTPDLAIANDFFENSSLTVALVETASITGTAVTGSEVVVDTVALSDGGADDVFFFNAPVVGPDGSFFPAGARRLADGVDTDTAADWAISDFNLGPANTPTAAFVDAPPPPPPADITLISAIQGSGDASARVGQVVTVEAIVVGDFQNGDADDSRNLGGFYLQEEDADADGDASTSEGIFIFQGNFAGDVNIGDKVRVTGTVDEFFGETQLDTITAIEVISSGNELPTAAVISLPAAATTLSQDGRVQPDLEAFEGMRVVFAEALQITEMFQLDRFNEIKLSQGDRPAQFTQNNLPSVEGYAAHLQEVGARTITYDDGLSTQNTPITNLDGFANFNTANAPRMGDTIANLEGILTYQWAGNAASGATWRVRSAVDGTNTFEQTTPRLPTPEPVGGSLKVASFNVLNYFTTIDAPGVSTANGSDPRGADDLTQFGVFPATAEFDRQTDKLVSTILAMDVDVLGLVELENDFLPGSSGNAIEFLVNELNSVAGAQVYGWVNPGQQFVDASDAISVGVIYQLDAVTLAPNTRVEILRDEDLAGLGLDFGQPVFNGPDTSRAPLAVSFQEVATGGVFTVAVNHFKSKGGAGTGDDADANDGAGAYNGTRLRSAIALDAWLDTDPTGSGDSDFLILGDLNSYAQEDPIRFLASEGYVDLAQQLIGPDAYSYVFDGQTGTLDYVLASTSLTSQVTGITEWHVNSDEADALDYNLDFGRDPAIFDGTVPYRNSDHDPVIVGLALAGDEREPVSLRFGQQRARTLIQAFENDVLVDEVRGRQNQAVPDVGPFAIFAVDSPDAGKQAAFVDRTWLDQGEGIGIRDGDDGNTARKKRIDGDEVLGIAINGFEAKDALVNVDRVRSQDGAEIRIEAYAGTTLVDAEVFVLGSGPVGQLQTLSFSSDSFFDTLYLSAADTDTEFTFRTVELPTAFAV